MKTKILSLLLATAAAQQELQSTEPLACVWIRAEEFPHDGDYSTELCLDQLPAQDSCTNYHDTMTTTDCLPDLMDQQNWSNIKVLFKDWAHRTENLKIYDYIEEKHSSGQWGGSSVSNDQCQWTCTGGGSDEVGLASEFKQFSICHNTCNPDEHKCSINHWDGEWEECNPMVKDKETWNRIKDGVKTWAEKSENMPIYNYVEDGHNSGRWNDYKWEWKCVWVTGEDYGHVKPFTTQICYNEANPDEHLCTIFFDYGNAGDCMPDLMSGEKWDSTKVDFKTWAVKTENIPIYEYINQKHESGQWNDSYPIQIWDHDIISADEWSECQWTCTWSDSKQLQLEDHFSHVYACYNECNPDEHSCSLQHYDGSWEQCEPMVKDIETWNKIKDGVFDWAEKTNNTKIYNYIEEKHSSGEWIGAMWAWRCVHIPCDDFVEHEGCSSHSEICYNDANPDEHICTHYDEQGNIFGCMPFLMDSTHWKSTKYGFEKWANRTDNTKIYDYIEGKHASGQWGGMHVDYYVDKDSEEQTPKEDECEQKCVQGSGEEIGIGEEIRGFEVCLDTCNPDEIDCAILHYNGTWEDCRPMLEDRETWNKVKDGIYDLSMRNNQEQVYYYLEDLHVSGNWTDHSSDSNDQCQWTCTGGGSDEVGLASEFKQFSICYNTCNPDEHKCSINHWDGEWEECNPMVKDKETWNRIKDGVKTWAEKSENMPIYNYVEDGHSSGRWNDYKWEWKCVWVTGEDYGHSEPFDSQICYNEANPDEHLCTVFFDNGNVTDCMPYLMDVEYWYYNSDGFKAWAEKTENLPIYEYILSKHESGEWNSKQIISDDQECEWKCAEGSGQDIGSSAIKDFSICWNPCDLEEVRCTLQHFNGTYEDCKPLMYDKDNWERSKDKFYDWTKRTDQMEVYYFLEGLVADEPQKDDECEWECAQGSGEEIGLGEEFRGFEVCWDPCYPDDNKCAISHYNGTWEDCRPMLEDKETWNKVKDGIYDWSMRNNQEKVYYYLEDLHVSGNWTDPMTNDTETFECVWVKREEFPHDGDFDTYLCHNQANPDDNKCINYYDNQTTSDCLPDLKNKDSWNSIRDQFKDWASRTENLKIYDYIEEKHSSGQWGDSSDSSDQCQWTCTWDESSELVLALRVCYNTCNPDEHSCSISNWNGEWEECNPMVKDKETWNKIKDGVKTWAEKSENMPIYNYVEDGHNSGRWNDYKWEWKCVWITGEDYGHNEPYDSQICYNQANPDEHLCTTFGDDGSIADCIPDLMNVDVWNSIGADFKIWAEKTENVPVYEYINSKHESGAWSGSYNQNDHQEQVCESENWQCNDFYQCEDDLKRFDGEYCWIEECWNECGVETCEIFRTDDSQYNQYDGTYYWTTEECPAEPVDQFAESTQVAQEQASAFASGFNKTISIAIEEFCPNGECIIDPTMSNLDNLNQSAPVLNDTQINEYLNQTFQDESTVKVANSAIEEAEVMFGIDLQDASEIVNRNQTAVQELVAQAQEQVSAIFETSWVSDWFGFSSGDKNEGQSRKGTRDADGW